MLRQKHNDLLCKIAPKIPPFFGRLFHRCSGEGAGGSGRAYMGASNAPIYVCVRLCLPCARSQNGATLSCGSHKVSQPHWCFAICRRVCDFTGRFVTLDTKGARGCAHYGALPQGSRQSGRSRSRTWGWGCRLGGCWL